VFGKESLMEMEAVGCPAYKLASLDREAKWLFDAVRATGKPVIVSRPDHPDPRADATLWCPEGYPQQALDFDELERGKFDGFSYHGVSTAIPSWSASIYGAKMVEVHFQLDDEPSELEASISLRASQFKMMTEYVRLCERNQKVAA
jgi:sialic acid synthase SpsE